jgi:hypothetical protein
MRCFLRIVSAGLLFASGSAFGCELCAIYSADNARGASSSGFLVSISEQFVPYRVTQFEGDHLDSSITHIVPTYNFSPRFGLSLNVPIVYNSFKRTDFRYSTTPPSPVLETERGSEFGISDVALIGRGTVFQLDKTDYAMTVNVLAGVKFPTGDSSRIQEEIEQSRIFDSFVPPGTPHDPLSHSISGVHQHMIAPGSGSYDGIFGLTLNTRWKRLFFNSQFQYYLRTEGEHEFEFGDEILVSGGPGGYLVVHDEWTLGLQFNGFYESEARDKILGQKTDRTSMTAWYVGPQLSLTWGDRLAANAGADFPLRIANNGLQNVPEYRIHGGVSFRF